MFNITTKNNITVLPIKTNIIYNLPMIYAAYAAKYKGVCSTNVDELISNVTRPGTVGSRIAITSLLLPHRHSFSINIDETT